MNRRHIKIHALNLEYFAGIAKLEIKNNQITIDDIFQLIDQIQQNNPDTMIQFFNEKYILNEEHVYRALYFLNKSYLNGTNISNKKNIEFFLYLAANRQIRFALDAFGLDQSILNENILTYCILSPSNNIFELNKIILDKLNANEITISFTDDSIDRIKRMVSFFELSELQLKTIIKSLDAKEIESSVYDVDPIILKEAIMGMITERMALLSIEKV